VLTGYAKFWRRSREMAFFLSKFEDGGLFNCELQFERSIQFDEGLG
jgi:hypothetical protein